MKRETMSSNYNALVKLCQELETSENPITVSSYLTGEKYFEKEKPRLLVLGRALNGWMSNFNELEKWEEHNNNGTVMKGRYYWDKKIRKYKEVGKSDCKGLDWVYTYLEYEKSKRKLLTADIAVPHPPLRGTFPPGEGV